MSINKEIRQKAIIEALTEGPKTVKILDELVTEKLSLNSLISSATRNRDLRDLREKGFKIEVKRNKASEPEYILKNTRLDLECDSKNIASIIKLIKFGLDSGLVEDKNLERSIMKLSATLNLPLKALRIDGLKKITKLNSSSSELIEKAISKNCAIEFKIKQPSDSKIRTVRGYPQEIFIQDKFIYLSIKRPAKDTYIYDWREYRLDRFIELEKSKYIKIYPKDKDPFSDKCHKAVKIKLKVFPPLTKFFEADMYKLEKIESRKEFDLYEGSINKPPFRIIKDFLALLPHVQIIDNKELAEEFNSILKSSLR
jgi:hypothetical protein